ncbi:hypothetical protein HZS_5483 [Henneguya salminicola]|nr:hypothetical protein HZS_5483 [Henneguya salminicola]
MQTRKRKQDGDALEYTPFLYFSIETSPKSSETSTNIVLTAFDRQDKSLLAMTPKTRELISLCKKVESDIAKLDNSDDEIITLKKIIEKFNFNIIEKNKLIQKLSEVEFENTEKDCKLRKLQQRLLIYEENEKFDPIRKSNFVNIQSLKSAILKLQDENKTFKNIETNFLILKEQLENSKNHTNNQESQLKIYKEWIEKDRTNTINELDKARESIQNLTKTLEVTHNDLNSFKSKQEI